MAATRTAMTNIFTFNFPRRSRPGPALAAQVNSTFHPNQHSLLVTRLCGPAWVAVVARHVTVCPLLVRLISWITFTQYFCCAVRPGWSALLLLPARSSLQIPIESSGRPTGRVYAEPPAPLLTVSAT